MTSGAAKCVVVERYAVHVPGLSWPELTPGADEAARAATAQAAHTVLGRKGLLGRDQATRLALCAVHRMFGLPPGPLAEPLPHAARTAVVVASNLGNAGGVCEMVDAVRGAQPGGISPVTAPNASSNIVASSIAIRYGFTGPNVMVCSGATAGLDAVEAAALLLRAGRCDRAVVVGVEPDDDVAVAAAAHESVLGGPLTAAAAALLLRAGDATGIDGTDGTDGTDGVRLSPVVRGPEPGALPLPAGTALAAHPAAPGIDLTARIGGASYGALGVLQVALAAALLAGEAPAGLPHPADAAVSVTCGCPDDGYAALRVSRTPQSAATHGRTHG